MGDGGLGQIALNDVALRIKDLPGLNKLLSQIPRLRGRTPHTGLDVKKMTHLSNLKVKKHNDYHGSYDENTE